MSIHPYLETKFTPSVQQIKGSAVREILKSANRENCISLAGGIPAPECYPLEIMQSANKSIWKEYGDKLLQYSISEGILPLREWVAQRITAQHHVETGPENILIVSGSQQALDLVGRLFLEPGDEVLLENPSYSGALQAFRYYQPKFLGVDLDFDGPIMNELNEKCRNGTPAFFYGIPDFQNPTGLMWSESRRLRVVKKLLEYQIPIVEDAPYAHLDYRCGLRENDLEKLPSLYQLSQGQSIYLGSFSKVLAPGLRMGYICAPKAVITKLNILRQGSDLHSSVLNQYLVWKSLEKMDTVKHLKNLREVYCDKRDTLIDSLEEFFGGDSEGNLEIQRPEGGMFLWVQLKKFKTLKKNTKELLKYALQEGVSFVPGNAFFTDNQGHDYLRLNFTFVSKGKLYLGAKRLHAAYTKYLSEV